MTTIDIPLNRRNGLRDVLDYVAIMEELKMLPDGKAKEFKVCDFQDMAPGRLRSLLIGGLRYRGHVKSATTKDTVIIWENRDAISEPDETE